MNPIEDKTAEQCSTCKEKKKWSYRKIFLTAFWAVSIWNKIQGLYDKYGKMVLSWLDFE